MLGSSQQPQLYHLAILHRIPTTLWLPTNPIGVLMVFVKVLSKMVQLAIH